MFLLWNLWGFSPALQIVMWQTDSSNHVCYGFCGGLCPSEWVSLTSADSSVASERDAALVHNCLSSSLSLLLEILEVTVEV